MLFHSLLNGFLHWHLPISSSNWCRQCLYLLAALCLGAFLGCSVLSLSISQGPPEVSLGLLCAVTDCARLFLSSSEVTVYRRLWGKSGTCSLQGPVDVVWVLEQPICRKLLCWLSREAQAGGGASWGFAPVPRT